MKNKFLLPAVFLLATFSASGCSKAKDKIIIRVLNSADYIYEADEEGWYVEATDKYVPFESLTYSEEDETYYDENGNEAYYDSDMMAQFVKFMDEKYADQGLKFDYIYDTFDTPETCYNELMTGKSNYDVINVSDYMVQKMMTHDLIQPLFEVKDNRIEEKSRERIIEEDRENIGSYVSKFLWEDENNLEEGEESDAIFNNIHAKLKDYADDADPYDYNKCLADYSVPYMWGTVGIMYNYSFYDASKEAVDAAFSSWEVLYNDFAKNSFSIKDSVRDVYAVSILHAFKDEIKALEEQYLNIEEPDPVSFRNELTKIFNSCDEKTIARVKEDMLKLKDNAFGFEVDSGKTDMVAGDKIGANLAWSGDAAWAIYEAQTESDVEIAFQVPEEGSNIWFDAWCIPTVANNPVFALDFIEFMSEPEQAIANMDYVGYTSATASDEVLEYVYDSYDVRLEVQAEEEYYPDEEYEEYDIRYFFEDCLETYDIDDAILHAWTPETEETYSERINGEDVDVSYAVQARMLKAQFPTVEQLTRLCVMDDYGKNNEKVLDMWQSVRTNPLPVWAIILFALEGALLLFVIAYIVSRKTISKKLRQKYSQSH